MLYRHRHRNQPRHHDNVPAAGAARRRWGSGLIRPELAVISRIRYSAPPQSCCNAGTKESFFTSSRLHVLTSSRPLRSQNPNRHFAPSCMVQRDVSSAVDRPLHHRRLREAVDRPVVHGVVAGDAQEGRSSSKALTLLGQAPVTAEEARKRRWPSVSSISNLHLRRGPAEPEG